MSRLPGHPVRTGAAPRGRRRHARGAAAVELAILFPLLMAIFFSIMEWGFVVYNKAVLTNAAREGARTGIVLRTVAQRTAGADVAAAEARAVSYCNGALITMSGSNTCTATTTPSGGKVSGVGTLAVTVNHTYNGTGLMALYKIMNGPIVLSQRAVMTYE